MPITFDWSQVENQLSETQATVKELQTDLSRLETEAFQYQRHLQQVARDVAKEAKPSPLRVWLMRHFFRKR